jgi:hypothetical protein
MGRARASRRRIAEMSFVLRALLDDMAAVGGLKGRAHREALDVVDAFARGEQPAPEAFAKARAGVAKVVGQIGVGSSPLLLALSHVPIPLLFRMVEEGEDLSKYVLEHAVLAVAGVHPSGAQERVDELCTQAVRLAAGMDDTAVPPPAHEIVVSGNAHDLDLPAIAVAHLGARKAARTGKHADAKATAALLTSRGSAVHPAVLAFERAYGGLELFESDPDAAALVVGPYALFSVTPRSSGRGDDLVPVAVALDDVCYALDSRGRGFTKAAMVEGVFRPSAPDGRSLLTQAILWRALVESPRSFVTREGLEGAAIAKERGIPALAEATGETERWWGDARGTSPRLVVEIDRGNGHEGPMTYATSEP